jgi:hypothetical protein
MMHMNHKGFILVALGLFIFAGTLSNLHWFMNARKARSIVGLIGIGGARVLYGVLGIVVTVFGASMVFGVMEATIEGKLPISSLKLPKYGVTALAEQGPRRFAHC